MALNIANNGHSLLRAKMLVSRFSLFCRYLYHETNYQYFGTGRNV